MADPRLEDHAVGVELQLTELTEELERLCERRILRIEGLRFRFRYDLVRQALLASISPARQRLLHQRLAALAAESSPFSITQTTSSMTG